LHSIKANVKEDVLGRFYGEFMRYSGGDGQSLGVVLTPDHIAELFCDLAQLKPTDRVFDPCCGTAAFLIAAMHRMEQMATSPEQKKYIKSNQLHGIEIREDMFSIATTNMILRDDGKSNLVPANFLSKKADDLRQQKYTVGFMNPPYSQAKGKDTAHLSEICFIEHLLNSLDSGGRCVVIVPQSTMVGKTKEDKKIKQRILEKHTLEGVITLNKNTFYGIGTNPCIAVFTAHQAHNPKKYCKFVNYEDDGFVVGKHIGLVETARAKERKTYLLDCWLHDKPTETQFMVRTTIEPDDEWLHSFYYFNDEIPKPEDFEKTIAEYLTFEFSMIMQGRDYLFDQNANNEKKKPEPEHYNHELKNVQWGEFEIGKLFKTYTGGDLIISKIKRGNIPVISHSMLNNGVAEWTHPINGQKLFDYTTTISLADRGNFYAFTQQVNFYIGTRVKALEAKFLNCNKAILQFICPLINKQAVKFSYGNNATGGIEKLKILLPITPTDEPDYVFMEAYMRRIEQAKTDKFCAYIAQRIAQLKDTQAVAPLTEKEWGEFEIGKVFKVFSTNSSIDKNKLSNKKGEIPYITRSDKNNAIDFFIGNQDDQYIIDKGNVITIGLDTQTVFYQSHSFYTGQNIQILSNDTLNCHKAQFLIPLIKKQMRKFNWGGNGATLTRLKRSKIMLPLTPTGEPDYVFMEAYMRRIELEKLTTYMARKTTDLQETS
jgi:hypothetical protein